ncbi:MAG TPA: Holliday junction resolvase RuvX, partial [Legionellales bacterium]|nr:Holliday junction resolvase RuvX [Legionellales bacterium]
KRIGVAVGQRITGSASPLVTLPATQGIPQWSHIAELKRKWRPQGWVVGLPTCIDDSHLYTTDAARKFALQLELHMQLPVYLVDERLSTKEARARLFNEGGFKRLKHAEVDSMAAVIILEQWLNERK